MFQTKIEIPPTSLNITYKDSIMTLGSCFAENIGKKMQEVYFEVDINPFGVLYNPVSICNSIHKLIDAKPFSETSLFENRGLWQSFSHSSLFSDVTARQCLNKINDRFSKACNFLQKADYLLITFGTAWVFEEQQSGSVVSNCHKLPASQFIRRRLTVEEIIADYSRLITKLNELFPHVQLIFSVSPIRHWKDGAHGNNVSKSTLLLAVDALQEQFKQVHYFPAYEIQLDELRDYRFYAPDMLHPSDVAVDYIWQRFSETYFSNQTMDIKKQLEQLVADLAHRPIHPDSVEFRKFQENIGKRKKEILASYPFLSERI